MIVRPWRRLEWRFSLMEFQRVFLTPSGWIYELKYVEKQFAKQTWNLKCKAEAIPVRDCGGP
jgi:hypothetical protein